MGSGEESPGATIDVTPTMRVYTIDHADHRPVDPAREAQLFHPGSTSESPADLLE